VRSECRPDAPRQQIVHHQGHELVLPEVVAASKVLHETHVWILACMSHKSGPQKTTRAQKARLSTLFEPTQ